jgi:glycosyltransferase involved in cell wall biosynthesis
VHDRLAEDYLPGRTARLLQTLARRVPQAVVANSAATAATLPGARGLGVVHPGLALAQVAPTPRTRQPDGPPVVLMVGRIGPTKGQLVLVRAARRVVDVRPDARVRIVGAAAFGADAYAANVLEEVHALGLAHAVELVGFTDDPRAELDRAAVAVHAATVPEPFGQVVTEAMAAGVPVVATRGGGVDEIVRTGADGLDTGLLVPPGDADALAEAVLDVLDQPEAALARAARAHADVTTRFLATGSAQALTRVWEQAARDRPARHPGRQPS